MLKLKGVFTRISVAAGRRQFCTHQSSLSVSA